MAALWVMPMSENDLTTLAAGLLAALAVSMIVFVLVYPYLSGERQTEERYRAVTENRAKVFGPRATTEAAAQRRQNVVDTLKELEARQKDAEKVSLRLRLRRAGLHMTPKVFWLISVLCGVSLALMVNMSLPPSGSRQFLAIAVAVIGTFGLPRWILNRIAKRRQAKFLAELANAIDVVVRGVKSGLPLNECLVTIANESAEPLASEFRDVVDQQRIGLSLGEALERMMTHMPLAEVKYLTIVIAIQQQAGGNLSEALGNLAGVLRDRFRLRMKVSALSAEAKASAAVLASLPPGVMFMVYGASPDYIMPLFATRTGNLMLLVGACWMLIGVLVMRKMINFKF
jgi:tight adherence protein B